MNSKNWSSDEFMCFMMLYAALTDNYYAPEEKESIIKNVGKDVHDYIFPAFISMTDFERLEAIASFRDKYIDTPEKKTNVLSEMEKVFKSDGEFAKVEQEVLKTMDKIL